MIKINLALKKTSGASTSQTAAALPSLDTGALLSPAVGWIVFSVVLYIGADWYFGDQRTKLLQSASAEIESLTAQSQELKTALGKMKQYEEVKKALESDEKVIKSKLDTILQLSKDRDAGIEYLRAISRTIPKEVWLVSLDFGGEELNFKGQAAEFGMVSDFASQLSQTQLFVDVQQENATNVTDEQGKSLVAFELKGRRK